MRHRGVFSVAGVFQSFNLSPKGIPEGFVCRDGQTTFQVNFPPELANEVAKRVSEGKPVQAEVVPFDDAESDAHPVYELGRLAGGDRPLVIDGAGEEDVRVSGTVVRLNYAKRGEINGAILDEGDFVHLRPHGVKAVGGLQLGQRLEVQGDVRPGWAGCRVIEARICNGLPLNKPGKHDLKAGKHPATPPADS